MIQLDIGGGYMIQNTKIESSDKQIQLSTSVIVPNTTIKGIIQIVHGMCEHKERYYDFMKFLSQNGYVVIINDHRGHGKSIKDKPLGYFYTNGEEYIVEDTYLVTKYIKHRFNDKKLYILGHSMGTLIARNYLQKYDAEIEKLILMSPPYNYKQTSTGLILTRLLKIFLNETHQSKLLDKIVFGSYNQNFKKEKNPKSWICSNKDEVIKYQQDPLCGYVATINGYETLFKLLKSCYQSEKYKVNNQNLKIHFMVGSDDPVIGNLNLVNEQILLLNKIGYKNTTLKTYQNKRHELLNEDNKLEIYNDVLNYLNK